MRRRAGRLGNTLRNAVGGASSGVLGGASGLASAGEVGFVNVVEQARDRPLAACSIGRREALADDLSAVEASPQHHRSGMTTGSVSRRTLANSICSACSSDAGICQ